MTYGFWQQLTRPFAVQAPMSGYTDAAFRATIAKYGKPDVMYTEFVPSDGLCSAGQCNLLHNFVKCEAERPVVAQIYGGNPDNFREAARFVVSLGFDGIDINMGCPAKAIEKRRGGSDLIRDPARAREIILATMDGAGELPVSVKTRIGYRTNELETWIPHLLQTGPAALTIHARRRCDTYLTPANWDHISRAVEIAMEMYPDPAERPLIIGNGDVASLADGVQRVKATGCDGFMVGRAMFGDPWFFNPAIERADRPLPEILEIMLEHTETYINLFGDTKHLAQMKKHYKAYANSFNHASKLRFMLMETNDLAELKSIVREAVDKYC